MKKIIFFSCILALMAAGCRNKSARLAASGQGMITYNVSYPDSNRYGMKLAFFPKNITLVFKEEKAAFIATGGLGMVQLVNLLDHKQKKYTSLLIDAIRENYGCTLTPYEITANENSSKVSFELTDETKIIAGIKCKSAIVKDMYNNSSFKIFYNDQKHFCYNDSPFHDFDYLMMEYTHTVNGLTMKLTASETDFTSPVDTNLFNVKGKFKWVNQKELFARINEL